MSNQKMVLGLYPEMPTPGALGVVTSPDKMEEIKELEKERELRPWEVRAYLSDHVPLAGNLSETLQRTGVHFLHVNPKENPLWIYLHAGGRRAVYYGLFNDAAGKLDYIAVKVQTRLPSIAIMLARGPLNALLDVMVRNNPMPLIIRKLDLISPRNGEVLLSECLIPEARGVEIGPLGGIMQAPPFARRLQ
jgi:hypothetical protein